MKRFKASTTIVVFASILAVIGCAHFGQSHAEKMLTLASALTKLSAAVESTVRYKNPPQNITDTELLEMST
ncbi:MAG: hypothetical protein AB1861_15010 [Cyanobacteriota bacterium]